MNRSWPSRRSPGAPSGAPAFFCSSTCSRAAGSSFGEPLAGLGSQKAGDVEAVEHVAADRELLQHHVDEAVLVARRLAAPPCSSV